MQGRGISGRKTTLMCALIGALIVSGCKIDEDNTGPAAQVPLPVIDSASPAGSYLSGRFAQHMDDWRAAADYVAITLDSDPDNIDLIRRGFLLRLGDGRIESALPLARRLAELKQGSHLEAALIAADLVKAGRFDDARAALLAMPADGIGQYVAPLLLAWVELARSGRDAAEAALAPLADAPGMSALHDLHAGLVAEQAGDRAAADRWFSAALKAGTPPLRLVQLVGEAEERAGRPETAARLYETFARDNPDNLALEPALRRLADKAPPPPTIATPADGMAEALFNVASALHQEGVEEMALLYGRVALHVRPDFGLVHLMLGDIFYNRGRFDGALEEYTALSRLSGYEWMARLRMALALQSLKRAPEAIALLREMSAQRPERADALTRLGDLYRTEKRFDEAIRTYGEALARGGGNDARDWVLYYARGMAFDVTHQWERAEADLLRAVELQPNQATVLNYLGYSWAERGVNLDRAVELIRQALALDPDDGNIVDSLGWAFYRQGRYADAVRELERAIELKPMNAVINDHLGDAYWAVGRRHEARVQWRRALSTADSDEQDLVEAVKAKLEKGGPATTTDARPAAAERHAADAR